MVNQYVLSSCAGEFIVGNKTTWTLKDNNFILPLMRDALNHIIAENTHHMDRAKALLSQLSGELAAPLEPTYDELNPPPEPEKEYRFSLGDIVYIGAQEYDILSLDEESVVLYDPEYPLFNKEFSREDFEAKVKENPLNDKYLVTLDAPAIGKEELLEEKMEELINEFCQEEYQDNADFSDPYHVSIAYSTTEDSEHEIEVQASIPEHRIIFFVDQAEFTSIQCKDADDFIEYLANLEFDDLIGFAEHQWNKAQASEEKKPVGRIDFLGTNGEVGESVEYDDADALEKAVRDETEYGAPMTVVLFEGEDSKTIPQEFLSELDPPPTSFHTEVTPSATEQSEPLEPIAPPAPKRAEKLPPALLYPEIHSAYRHCTPPSRLPVATVRSPTA